jgi:hypothetical protein
MAASQHLYQLHPLRHPYQLHDRHLRQAKRVSEFFAVKLNIDTLCAGKKIVAMVA